ncbi:transposase [Thalassolituus oleivorans]|uniref:transposase n=1 Tax=Thalassolituus oleivorans TaxID=187493 RepID=UPI001E5C0B61|nr:transposase [Thalassolituus oleivorans]
MARRRRLYLPDCPLHIIQRGNNRDACFRDDSDYKAYLHFMREAATQYGVAIHPLVFMTNHVHILANSFNRRVCEPNDAIHWPTLCSAF